MADHNSSSPTSLPEHPGKRLREFLDERRWTQEDLAFITGYRRQTISSIVAGRSGITPEMAVALAAAFGNDPADWIQWDRDYQLSLVEADPKEVGRRAQLFDLAPIREMQKRGWIRDTSDLGELEAELRTFFGGRIEEGISFPVAARRSVRLTGLNPAESAWCFRARQLASSLVVAQFSPDRLEQLERRLRKLAAYPAEMHRVARLFAEYGVRFVVVEPLPGAKIDGAAFWIGDSPVIAVSLRWDQIDVFWFTVMHELGHIKNGDVYSIDSNLVSENEAGAVTVVVLAEDRAERLANAYAQALLVPQDELDSFIRRLSPLYSAERIVQFAHKIKMHPGIIVGQLRHRGEVGYSAHREFMVKVRAIVTETTLTDGWGQSMSPGIA